MKILKNTLPISDIFNMMKSGELTINRSYQREKGLWPDNARSYFIDTILNGFPFPKIIIRQTVDLKTKTTKREIIDGQQRLTTIRDFLEGKMKMTSVSKHYSGLKHEEIPDDALGNFLSYEISIDNVVSATTEEILEIFRRINSYTLPLNPSEQRHATFQGKFKWFISGLSEYFTPFFEEFKTLSLRDISRMADADLLTECCQLKIDGIQDRNPKRLNELYNKFDSSFEIEPEISDAIIGSFDFIKNSFIEVFEVVKVSSFNFYSLIGALIFNRYGLPDKKGDLANLTPQGQFVQNVNRSRNELIRALNEVDSKILDGYYSNFVDASIATTHRYRQRLARIKTIIEILQLP